MNRKVVIDVLDDMMRLKLEAEALDVLTEQRDQLLHDLQAMSFLVEIFQSELFETYNNKDVTTQISRSTTDYSTQTSR